MGCGSSSTANAGPMGKNAPLFVSNEYIENDDVDISTPEHEGGTHEEDSSKQETSPGHSTLQTTNDVYISTSKTQPAALKRISTNDSPDKNNNADNPRTDEITFVGNGSLKLGPDDAKRKSEERSSFVPADALITVSQEDQPSRPKLNARRGKSEDDFSSRPVPDARGDIESPYSSSPSVPDASREDGTHSSSRPEEDSSSRPEPNARDDISPKETNTLGSIAIETKETDMITKRKEVNGLQAHVRKTHLDRIRREVLETHNVYRARHGVPPLELSNDINIIAQRWAEKMAKTGKFEHSPPSNRPNCGENLYFAGSTAFDLGDVDGKIYS